MSRNCVLEASHEGLTQLRDATLADAAAGGRPVKRSLTIAGHRTSISLEEDFWTALHGVARAEGKPVPTLIFEIDSARGATNLSSAIRVFLLAYFRTRAR